jgi:hypothetical protein
VTARSGQATVEWLAVLLMAVAVAGGTTLALGHALREAVPLQRLLTEAVADESVAVAPQLPLLVDDPLPPTHGTTAVAIARQLLAAGIRELPPGSNRGPGIDAFTDGNAEAWCADFVSWVLRAAGYAFTGGASSGWRLAWTGAVRAWFVARDAFRERLLADPQPGDVVWFVHGHVGIVERISAGALITIEGNASDAVTRRSYPGWRLNHRIGGFGRPGL